MTTKKEKQKTNSVLKEENKKAKEILNSHLQPSLEPLTNSLKEAFSGIGAEEKEPFKLTITLSAANGVRTQVKLCSCRNPHGDYVVMPCPCR